MVNECLSRVCYSLFCDTRSVTTYMWLGIFLRGTTVFSSIKHRQWAWSKAKPVTQASFIVPVVRGGYTHPPVTEDTLLLLY